MAGLNLAPFPRQTLVGGTAMAPAVYYSETYDLEDYRTLTYAMETTSSLPANASVPAVVYLQASNDLQGPWEELLPGGDGPTVGNTVTAAVTVTGRYLRVRVEVVALEIATLAVWLVARTE